MRTKRIGYQYVAATADQAEHTGLLFTLTSTLRGHVWTCKVYGDGQPHRYFRGGRPAPLPEYASALAEVADRLFKSASKESSEARPLARSEAQSEESAA